MYYHNIIIFNAYQKIINKNDKNSLNKLCFVKTLRGSKGLVWFLLFIQKYIIIVVTKELFKVENCLRI